MYGPQLSEFHSQRGIFSSSGSFKSMHVKVAEVEKYWPIGIILTLKKEITLTVFQSSRTVAHIKGKKPAILKKMKITVISFFSCSKALHEVIYFLFIFNL